MPARMVFEKQADLGLGEDDADTEREPTIEEAPLTMRPPSDEGQLTDLLTAPDTEKLATFGKPEILHEISGFRNRTSETLEQRSIRQAREITRLRAALEAKDIKRIRDLEAKDIKRRKREDRIRKQHEIALNKAREDGLIDELTKLQNRRAFNERSVEIASLALRHGTDFSILFLDLDKFKSINDTLDHDVGDEALKIVSDIIRETVRPEDEKFRHGGEEFVIILPNTDEKGAKTTAERLREAIKAQLIPRLHKAYKKRTAEIEAAKKDGSGTASIGINTYKAPPSPISNNKTEKNVTESEAKEFAKRVKKLAKKITNEADIAAKRAKKEGRDRTIMHGEEVEAKEPKTELFSGLSQVSEIEPPAPRALAILSQLEELIPNPEELKKTLREAIQILEKGA